MALTATIYRFQIELADIDRNVYESLDLRVAAHPSEDALRVVVRVLARAIAHEEGLEFGRGLSNAEDPALQTISAIGDIDTWIDVGQPGADRLHRASKKANRVIIVTDKQETPLRKEWSSRAIHQADQIELVRLPSAFVSSLADTLERKVEWYITIQEGVISVSGADGEQSLEGEMTRQSLESFVNDSQ